MKRSISKLVCRPCPPKPSLLNCKQLPTPLVSSLEGLFSILSSETRIRILHQLCQEKEMPVSALVEQLGMKFSAISNQLRLLADKGIVGARSEGNHMFYFMVDPCALQLLELGVCLALDAQKRRK